MAAEDAGPCLVFHDMSCYLCDGQIEAGDPCKGILDLELADNPDVVDPVVHVCMTCAYRYRCDACEGDDIVCFHWEQRLA